ncbi:MAG TPA: hypothetical protein DDZ80_21915 [Cyanobacteria bacterium UBA8803]|nr:hypothetical protein [Cyanobacteria bacterium UBA9273]HBL60988.1 hypothetical protein [Cyanobacteria bacterium UBA8803]
MFAKPILNGIVEEAWQRLNRELELTVEQRTAQLKQVNKQLLNEVLQHRQVEIALRLTQERLQYLLASTPAVIYTAKVSGNYGATFMSDNITALSGYEAREFLEDPGFWASHIHPEDAPQLFAELPELFDKGYHTHEYRFLHKDGTYRWVYDQMKLVRDKAGNPREIVGYWADITERKLSEQALRQSKERLKAIVNTISDGLLILNKQGRVIFANPAAQTLFGRPLQELLGTDLGVPVLVNDTTELVIVRPSEGIVVVEMRGAQTIWEDELVWVLSLRDISDRRQAEEKLCQSEANLAEAQKIAHVGTWEYDLKTQKITWSAETFRIFSLDPDRAAPTYEVLVQKLIHPDDRSEFEARVAMGIEYEQPFELDYRIVHSDGSIRHLFDRGKPILNVVGQVIGVFSTVLDITERKRAEEALRESERQFRQIFHHAPIGMSLIDFYTHQYIQVNPAYYEMLGYSASEIASLTFDDITHPDDLWKDWYYIQQIEQGHIDDFCMEKRYLKKNGEVVWANLTVTVLRDREGKPGFCLAMTEDITERQQQAEKITTSLLEKETLLKEIHHRVKNNLQIISSLLRLQARQIRDQNILELFQESQNRVQAMALIHEKLYQSDNLAQIDFQGYIQTLASNLYRSYGTNRDDVNLKIDVAPVSLAIDTAIPCGLIINELVSNALKYAFPDRRSGEIGIMLYQKGESARHQERVPPILYPSIPPVHINQEQFILAIGDNGVGLPIDLDFPNTNSLGLQLVCRLTKQLRGSIELHRNQGTEFQITFTSNRKHEEVRE